MRWKYRSTTLRTMLLPLHSVTNADQGRMTIINRRHSSRGDDDLEAQLRSQLDKNYDGCVSALQLINRILTES